jgi:hypothetical protein
MRKLLNLIQGQFYGLVFGHFGKLSMIALYFILTQWLQGQHVVNTILGRHYDFFLPNVKYGWDHLLSRDVQHGGLVPWLSTTHWNDVRHVVRPFMEGLFALLLYQQIGFNSQKFEAKTAAKPEPSKIDAFLIRVPLVPSRYKPITVAQEAAIPFIVLLVGAVIAVPMFLWVLPLLHDVLHASWVTPHLSKHPSFAEKLYANGYDAFAIGIIAGFAVKRITRPVLNANMLFICHRWLARGRKAHWWMPPGMRGTIHDLDAREDSAERREEAAAGENRWFGRLVVASAIVTFALAVYGYYIIRYIA